MKVETIVIPAEFKPVELKLTFESAEELEMFKHLMRINISVPDVVYPHPANQSKSEKLSAMMGYISHKMKA